ncbi:MAG: DUF1360 domain-containing protein [Acidimicrobiales bacterium]
MPDLVVLVVAALAVCRLTGLVVTDTITANVRNGVIARLDDRDATMGRAITTALTCPWCASIWIAAPAAVLVWFHGTNPLLVVPALMLAFSQVAGMTSSVGR